MSSTENHSLLDSKSIVERYHPGIRLLGAGDESFVFTDDVKVYKIFHTDFHINRSASKSMHNFF